MDHDRSSEGRGAGQELRLLFLVLTNDVGSDRIVSRMVREGVACAVLGRADGFAARVGGLGPVFGPPPFAGAWGVALWARGRLAGIARRWRPDLVVPLDDMAAHLLRDLAGDRRTDPGLRGLLGASLGPAEGFAVACSRERLVDLAAGLGLRVPAQRRVPDIADARAAAAEWGYPVVLKREQTCGGVGVAIVPDPQGLDRAFRAAARRARLKRRLRRWLGARTGHDGALTLQAFVPGALAMRMVACAGGTVLEGVSFAAERLHPAPVGASTMLRPIDNADMDGAARRIVGHLGSSGFVSFDFLLSPSGAATLIEMNPRPIASGHLGALFGRDVYGAFLAHRHGGAAHADAGPPRMEPRSVALFPREIDRDPASDAVAPGAAAHHDVPWDEPAVLEAYRAWLLARHPAQRGLVERLLAPAGPVASPPDRGGDLLHLCPSTSA